MQHHIEAYITATLASDFDYCLGYCSYVVGYRAKLGRVFRCSILSRSWSVVTTSLSIQGATSLLRKKTDIGTAESGLFPGVVYYFSMWYKRRERQFRISLFFSAAALAGSFGGILAYVSPDVDDFEIQHSNIHL